MDLDLGGSARSRFLGWMYWLPNPLLPFIWFRVALPESHPEIEVSEIPQEATSTAGRRSVTAPDPAEERNRSPGVNNLRTTVQDSWLKSEKRRRFSENIFLTDWSRLSIL
jgi:hypothetical protein